MLLPLRKKAMALPVILVVMLVVAIFFITAAFMTRNQQHLASFYLDSENAMNLAESAAQETICALRTLVFPDSNRPGLKKLFEQLLDVEAGKEQNKISLEPGPEIIKFMTDNEIAGTSPLSVKITAYLSQFNAISMPDSAVGIVEDPKEKEGLIKIEVRVEYGKAVKALNIIHKVKVARIVHPVLSRFSLFLKNAPAGSGWLDQINPLHQDSASLQSDPHAYFQKNNRRLAAPIILNHGKTVDLAPDGSYDFVSSKPQIEKLVSENAPVFLGGKWRLGMAEGTPQSQFSERFLVRLASYDIMESVEAFDRKARQTGNLSPYPRASIQAAYVQMFGMNNDWLMDTRAIPLENTQGFQFYRHYQDNTPILDMKGSSALRLFGSYKEFSPTMVLGDVERYYQRLVTMDCVFKNRLFNAVTMPFLDHTNFQRLRYPNQLGLYFRDSRTLNTLQGVSAVMGIRMGNDDDVALAWEFYPKQLSCTLISEHFMRGLDFILTNRETGAVGVDITKNNGTTPMPANGEIFSMLSSQALETSKVGATEPETPLKGREVTVKDKNGNLLFKGDLMGLDGYNDVLVRTAFKFNSKMELFEKCAWKKGSIFHLALPGNVILGGDSNSEIIFDEPVEIDRGGMIVVPGSVIIKAPIRSLNGETLTIVARDQIVIATSQPIEASLIAMKKISKDFSVDGFAIKGPVTSGELDLQNLVTGGNSKSISYSENFNELNFSLGDQRFPRRLSLSDEFRQYYGKAF
ncbi:MAG: hypothetical protein KKB51_14310 [Candidatus Riflebacteria bacterium]|nr:hypothetical protein [Candidatus Riflebacteria bacterium]